MELIFCVMLREMDLMDFKTRRRVGLLVETSRAYGRELLRGVALFARTRTDWSLLHQEMTLDSVMPD